MRADQGPIDQRSGPDVNIGSGDVSLKCRWEYTAEGDISIREEPSQGIRATSGGESRLERGGGVVSEEGGGGDVLSVEQAAARAINIHWRWQL